jgi:hypothetical protein
MNARIRLTVLVAAIALVAPLVMGAGTAQARPVHLTGQERVSSAPRLVVGETLRTLAELEEILGKPRLAAVFPTLAGKTAQPAVRRIPGVIENILEGAAGGVLVDAIKYGGKKLFKVIKKYVLKGTGKHAKLYENRGDGRCMADFSKGQITRLASCSDKTGIYWSFSSKGRLWDNHTGDMLTASSNKNGTKLYDWYPAHDWHTWTWGEVCANSSCSELYGIYWALYNSQSHKISDTTAASVG